jgi:hypothetical protein
MVVLPATEQLMKITCSHLSSIFTKELEKVKTDIEKLTRSHVIRRNTTTIFIGGFHETHHEPSWFAVVRIHISSG